MAINRPNAVVYQETDDLEVAPDIPDLDCLIVGPCYQILDYLDDKSLCAETTAYGTLNCAIPALPASLTYATPVAVDFASPANRRAGAEIDASSVKLFFDDVRALVTTADPAVTTNNAVYALGSNLFKSLDTLSDPTHHLGDAGVEVGDHLLVQSPGGSADHHMIVKELCYTFTRSGGGAISFLDAAIGDTITVSNDTAGGSGGQRDGSYVIKRIIDADNVEVTTVIPGSGIWTGADTADIIITDSYGNVKASGTTVVLDDWCYARMTDDFSEACVIGDTCMWRFERDLSDVEMDAADITVTGNSIEVAAGLTTDINTSLTSKPITYAKIYFEYMALRTDLKKMTSLNSLQEMEDTLGKLDARNPLYVGAYVAKLNTTTRIKVYGIADVANEEQAYLDFIDRVSAARELYCIVPLTYNTTVYAALVNMAENLADPTYVLDNGITQKFRAIIGAVELETIKYTFNATQGATAEQEVNTDSLADLITGTLGGTLLGALDMTAAGVGVLPGYTVTVDRDNVAAAQATYTVGHLNGALVFQLDPTATPSQLVAYSSAGAGEILEIKDTTGTVVYTQTSTAAPADITLATGGRPELFTIAYMPGASFLSTVLPGDILEIPDDPNGADWNNTHTYVIDEVVSNERIRVVNRGADQALVATELPHLRKRVQNGTGGVDAVTQGSIYIRIYRSMTKDQQVSEMTAVATSFFAKRLVLCYPDTVDVSGLVDGSLPRYGDTDPSDAASQPGYYLSCAVGGQTAGEPSQQGFTFLNIAGISAIYNSTDYFSENQLSDLSNGGVYVFAQDNPTALPYSIHEVTTDTTGLQTSEYMVIKNKDFVSWTFLDTLRPFLGVWNVTTQTIDFIRQAERDTIDVLKSRFRSKIGAPLIDATVTSTDISTLSSDRVETYIDADFPMVLNTIGLHLVG